MGFIQLLKNMKLIKKREILDVLLEFFSSFFEKNLIVQDL